MTPILKENKYLTEKLDLFIQTLEKEPLPDNVKLWISNVNNFGFIFVGATVSTRFINLNMTIDLLHRSINLFEIVTPNDIKAMVDDLVEEVKLKYGKFFTLPEDLRQ